MARDKGDPVDILQAIVDRLIAQIPEYFNDATCYLALSPDALAQNAGEITCVVAPLAGTFNEGYFDGGGQEQTTVEGGIVVKLHADMHLDHVERDTAFLVGKSTSILHTARRVLKALAGWSPTKDQDELTRDPLIPSAFNLQKSDQGLGAIELDFRCTFDWDLDGD